MYIRGVLKEKPDRFNFSLIFEVRKLKYFFFKQKTAYEIMPSLVGSEMCIRDRLRTVAIGI